MNAVQVQDLSIRYGDKPVLQHISCSVEHGEFFVIIGPNGSGKTTLLKTIAGLVEPDDGRVDILGKQVSDYSRKELARNLALVPQQMPLDLPFTVYDIVLMGRTPHLGVIGIEKQHDRDLVEKALAYTDIIHLAKRKIDQLSGGEIQRVVIARAICQEPKIVLLDEPTASLDPAHQIKVMDLMDQLRRDEGMTVIMVSHDLNLAAMYGNKLLLMKEGRVLKVGSPQEVLTGKFMERAYNCPMLIDENPIGNFPRVFPIPDRFLD